MNNAANWTVPVDHPAFAGHFPGTPILPGVVLLDTALQIIAGSCKIPPDIWPDIAADFWPDIYEISSVKFLSPAVPGDTLTIRHKASAVGTIRFDIEAGARKVASGCILLRTTI